MPDDEVQDPVEFDPEAMPPVPGQTMFTPRSGGQPIEEASPDNPVELRGGVVTADPRLGRVPEFDERSRSFPMAAVLAEAPKSYKPRSYSWSIGTHLDQGANPSCVGFAWTHDLLARPAVVTEGADFALWLYKTAQRYDAWSGEAYEGTSVIAGAKVIQKKPPALPEGRGLIGEYRWVFANLENLIKTLGYFGPVIFGTWWKAGMMQTDSEGYIRAKGENYGGHAYLVKAVDVRSKRFRVHNSWGTSWGQGGDAWLSFDDAMALLGEQGECCVPMRRYVVEAD